MVYLDNPAGRLHNVLALVRMRSSSEVFVRDVLADFLKVDPGDDAELLRGLAAVLELPSQVRREVLQLPVHDGMIEELIGVEKALSAFSLQARTDRWAPNISDAAMRELDICSGQLHGYRSQGSIPEQELTLIRQQIVSLLSAVTETDELPVELRQFLAENLHNMLRAVDTYKIRGVNGLRDAIEKAIGSYAMRPAVQKQTKKWVKWAKAFGAIVFKVFIALQMANEGTELLDRHFPELLPPSNGEPLDPQDVVDAEIVIDEESPAKD